MPTYSSDSASGIWTLNQARDAKYVDAWPNVVGPPEAVGHTLPFSGGTQWFSPGYFGVDIESEYAFANNADYTDTTLNYRAVQTSGYSWWILIVEDEGSFSYRPVWGARIDVPVSTLGQTRTATLTNSLPSAFGSLITPLTGTHYLAWLSGSAGQGNGSPSGSIYVDSSSNSLNGVPYVQYNSIPNTSTSIVATTTTYGSGIHIAVTV
jgi:hypothetical protein